MTALDHYKRSLRPKSELPYFFLMDEYRNLPVRQINRDTVSTYFRKFLGHSSHSGKRFFITDLANNNVDPSQIMLITKHKRLETIIENYLHNKIRAMYENQHLILDLQ